MTMLPEEALRAVVLSKFEGSTVARRLVIAHYKAKATDAELATFAATFLGDKSVIAQKGLAKLKARCEEVNERQRAVDITPESAKLIAESISIRPNLHASATGSVLLGGLAWSTNQDSARILATIDEHGREEARVLLQHQLAMFVQKTPDVSLDKLFQGKPAEILATLDSVHGVFESIGDGETRKAVQGVLLREIDAITRGTLKLAPIEHVKETLEASGHQVQAVVKTFLGFAQHTSQALATVSQAHNALQTAVVGLSALWKADGASLQTKAVALFADKYLNGQQSANQLLTAAKTSFWPGLSSEVVAGIAEKHDTLMKGMSGYLDASAALLSVAKDLKIKPAILEKANKLINAGQAAFSVATAVATGNPLQAIGAISGLIGKPRPDPAAQRHAQVMGKLAEIGQQLDVVLDSLQKIQQMQGEILKGIMAVQDSLVKLEKNLEQKHQEVMQKLDAIHQDIDAVKQLVIDKCNLRFCKLFHESLAEFKYNTNLTEYENQMACFAKGNTAYYYDEAFKALSPLLPALEDEFHSIFHAITIERTPQRTLWRTGVYEPLWKLITKRHQLPSPELSALLSMFLLPARSVAGLNAMRIANIANKNLLEKPIEEFMDIPLAPSAVIQVTRYLVEILPYNALVASDKKTLRKPEEIVKDGASLDRPLLRSALALIEITIAQQAFVSGHFTLPLLRAVLTNPNDGEQAIALKIIESALDVAPLLVKNLLLYWFAIRADGTLTDSAAYAFASSQTEDTLLRSIVGPNFPWKLVNNSAGGGGKPDWRVMIKDNDKDKLSIPTAEELRGGLMHYPVELDALLQLRARVAADLADINFLDEQTSDEPLRLAYAAALYHGA